VVEVKAPVDRIETAPFEEIALAVLEVTLISEPVVRPVVEITESPIPETIAPVFKMAKPVPR
jgi:hypothetical protein